MDIVPVNCCLVEIKPIYETKYNQATGNIVSQKKDTIFLGTNDGSLYAMRMGVKKEGKIESYVLNNLKKWTFSNPITSIVVLDFCN